MAFGYGFQINLLFLRIEAIWGGQLFCLQIGLFGSYYFKVNLELGKKIV